MSSHCRKEKPEDRKALIWPRGPGVLPQLWWPPRRKEGPRAPRLQDFEGAAEIRSDFLDQAAVGLDLKVWRRDSPGGG